MRIQPNKYFKYVIQNTKNKKIPIDWNYNKIGNLFNITSGGTPSTKNSTFWDGDIPWIGPSNMNNSLKYIYHGERYLTLEGACILNNKLVTKNSIILSTRAPVGYVKKAANDLYTNQGCHSLDALNSLEVDNDFFYYYLLNNKSTLENFSSGTTFKELSKKSLHNIDVVFPCIEQQQNISSVLSFQENQIENIKQLIKKIETRNQYYAEKILSGELRVRKDENGNIEFYNNTEWDEIKINTFIDKQERKIPLGWEKGIFSEHSKFTVGTPLHSSLFNYNNQGLQYLRTGDVWEDASSSKEVAFYNGDIDEKFIKKENDYLISLKGYNKNIGEGTLGLVTNYNNKKGIVCDNMYLVTPKEHDLVAYTAYTTKLNYIQNIILKTAVGSTARFATKMINKIEWIFPSKIEEMLLINSFFVSIDKEISSLKALLEKEQLRFQWLLDNLLSGEYQVVDE